MKKVLLATLLIMSLQRFVEAGDLFNVTTSGGGSSGTTLSITTNIPNHTYASAGIKLNTSSYTLSNPGRDCIPNKNGYCIFSVNNLTSKTIAISGGSGALSLTLCLNGLGPVSCQIYTFSSASGLNNAYVTNSTGGNPVLVCPIQSNGAFGSCVNSGSSGVAFDSPSGIAFNPAGTKAYVTNIALGNNSVSICAVNSDGTFGECIDSGRTGATFNQPPAITLNSSGTRAYVTNNRPAGPVSLCPIQADGTFGVCINSGAPSGSALANSRGITLNQSGTLAYITSVATNDVYICPVKTDGTFDTCVTSGYTGVAFSLPAGIALNADGTAAYVANRGNNTVSICAINLNGTFGTCVDSGNTGNAFSTPNYPVLNTSQLVAYVTNVGNSTVSMCPINGDGSFGACLDSQNTGVAFSSPQSIALL